MRGSNDNITTNWFHKKLLGRYLNYYSKHPILVYTKIGNIKNIADSAILLSDPLLYN